MANGIIIVDKPAGWTSQDVAAKLRGVFREKRVGHGGTLDPMATGVLPVFVGRATRAVEFFEHADKEYIATLRLGTITDTQDTTGTILETKPVQVTEAQLKTVLCSFVGTISQLPPMYSAIKINGQKLYELARRGKEVERKARPVTIHKLTLLTGAGTDFQIHIHCSKGTYVRTLCADIGERLGCGGCMAALRRTKAGKFTQEQAYTIEQLLAAEAPETLLLETDTLFSQYPAYRVNAAAERKLRNGAQVKTAIEDTGMCRIYTEAGAFLLLGKVQDGVVTTIKSFFEVK